MSKKKKTTSSTEPYSSEYKPWVYDIKDQVWTNLDTPAEAYTGDLTYGLTDEQKQAIQSASNNLNNDELNNMADGKYLDPESNPYLQKTYDIAAGNLKEQFGNMQDQINGQFSTKGVYNSNARRNALTDGAEQIQDKLTDFATQLYGNAYDKAATQQLQAIGTQSDLAKALMSAGSTEQQTEQAALDANYKEWLRQMGVDDANMQSAMQLLGLVKSPQQTSTQSDGGAAAGNAAGSIAAALITCFPAGAMVDMVPNGKVKAPIETIHIGDKVASFNDDLQKVTKEVINTEKHKEYIWRLQTANNHLDTTKTQPVITQDGLKVITDLTEQDKVLVNNKYEQVVKIFDTGRYEDVYDITVPGMNIIIVDGFAVEGGFTKDGE